MDQRVEKGGGGEQKQEHSVNRVEQQATVVCFL